MTKYSISGRTFKVDEFRFLFDHLSAISDVEEITANTINSEFDVISHWTIKIIIGGQLINIRDGNKESINKFHSDLLASWVKKD